jgi:hypothetical protein
MLGIDGMNGFKIKGVCVFVRVEGWAGRSEKKNNKEVSRNANYIRLSKDKE